MHGFTQSSFLVTHPYLILEEHTLKIPSALESPKSFFSVWVIAEMNLLWSPTEPSCIIYCDKIPE